MRDSSLCDAILIEGLKVDTVIGCFAWERQISQPLLLDLVVEHSLQAAALSDELADTVNYAQICELCAEVIQTVQPKLIEHAAHLVLEKLFECFEGIQRITLTIRKPAIIAEAHSVGIRLERQRHDFCTRTCE
ncbi:dihydroneopterin aldolase [Acinetobacter sp. MD2(2019)]|uniref:dihydroneopterin aldolase n=1 Tax=Acinetobacter sp. MD2(2019) TaxID=2605273 RepID=UPI002D1F1FAF|nr:dihydroneopterin aldolase [Acinetobacter sp. MD2(2019)]MEB3754763.1 dihydroneopterin aldolase [Acinetobacter sp. MD2(2019)]